MGTAAMAAARATELIQQNANGEDFCAVTE
jgi:hypothetical protein